MLSFSEMGGPEWECHGSCDHLAARLRRSRLERSRSLLRRGRRRVSGVARRNGAAYALFPALHDALCDVAKHRMARPERQINLRCLLVKLAPNEIYSSRGNPIFIFFRSQSLDGPFSAVSTPIFAIKYSLESA